MQKESSIPPRVANRLDLFPDSTRLLNEQLSIGGQPLEKLADQFGTPLYLYDRLTMDNGVAAYRQALSEYEGAPSDITYAGKAFLCRAIAEWVDSQGMWLDCTGETETQVAAAAN